MKKIILIIIFLLVSTVGHTQWFGSNPKSLLKLPNTWTGTQTFDSLINNSAIMSVSYSQLSTMIGSSSLIDGQMYLINNFATSHYYLDGDATIDTAINTGATEPLVVLATSSNTLNQQVFSPSYPNDLIYYDWNPANWTSDISFSSGGVIIPHWKGVIYYRSDTKNLITTYYDWRNIKLRRWAVTAPIYAGGTTYAKYDIVMGTDSAIYYSCVAANVGNALTDRTKWRCMLDYNTNLNPYLQWGDTISIWGYMKEDAAMKEFKLASATYQDVYTFGTTENKGIRLSLGKRLSNSIVNNITMAVDGTFSDNEIDDMCWNSSITANSFYYSKFGKYFYSNIIAGGDVDDANVFEGFFQNTVGSTFRKNTIEVDFAQNIINQSFAKNNIQVGFEFNHIGQRFIENSVGQVFQYNTVGDTVINNTIASNFTNNKIKSNFSYNTIGHFYYNNTVDEQFIYNTIGSNFKNNTIGNYFNDNIVGSNIGSATIGNGVEFNFIPSWALYGKTLSANRRWSYIMTDASYNYYYWKLLDNKLHLYNDNATQVFTVDSLGITSIQKLKVGTNGSQIDSVVASGDSLLFYYGGSKYKMVKE